MNRRMCQITYRLNTFFKDFVREQSGAEQFQAQVKLRLAWQAGAAFWLAWVGKAGAGIGAELGN